MSSHDVSRRAFIQTTAAATVGLGVAGSAHLHAQGANDRIVLAVIGTNGRGAQHAKMFSRMPGVEVGFICDPEEKALAKGMKAVSPTQANPAKAEKDFRRVLERKDVDGVVIAAPDHWHAPAAMLALAAGKDVFVEKPCSHNALEAELLAAAAKRYGSRVLQVGSQRRSWPNIIDLVGQLRDGSLIGRVVFRPRLVREHAGFDWLRQGGPGARRPRLRAVAGAGAAPPLQGQRHPLQLALVLELGHERGLQQRQSRDRRHALGDGRGLPDPRRVRRRPVSLQGRLGVRRHAGGDIRVRGDKSFIWEGRSCNGFKTEGLSRGITFHGENGSVLIDDHAYTVYDQKMKVVKKVEDKAEQSTIDTTGPGDRLDAFHMNNFIDCMRSRKTPNANIEEGRRSVMLCHLANIAYRVGHTVRCDPKNGHILDDPKAQALWGRTYEKGWEPEGFKG